MNTKTLLVAAAVLVTAACATKETQNPADENRDAASAPAPTLDDATIIAIFDEANTADIETGRLAAERARSKEVRDFGAMIARDHETVRAQGRALASRLGVTPTPIANSQSGRDHAATMARLGALSGSEFDRAFLEHEAAFHRAVIEAVQTQLLGAIQHDSLRALVVQVAPAFEAHMLAAQNLGQRVASR